MSDSEDRILIYTRSFYKDNIDNPWRSLGNWTSVILCYIFEVGMLFLVWILNISTLTTEGSSPPDKPGRAVMWP